MSLDAHASGFAAEVVQRSAAPGRAAALPAHGSGMVLPPAVQSKMEQAFSADFSGVRIHQGRQAPAMGALAYTAGTDIHFAPGQYDPHSSRGQTLLGHELAHVVQQAQGRVQPTVQAKGGVALNDDASLEREADLLGSRAARGEAAVSGHGPVAAPAQAGLVQRFAEENLASKSWRISDDQKMAVRQDSKVYGGRLFYAESGLIATSNAKLAGQKSSLSLSEDASDNLDAPSPDASKTTKLSRVVPKNLEDGSKGNDRATGMKWVEDCGLAANTVMHGKRYKTQGVYSGPTSVGKQGFWAQLWAALSYGEETTPAATYGTVYSTHRGRNFYSPHKMLDDILKAALEENDADKAWDKYKKLTATDRDTFDREVGINKYAAPEIGEAFTIVANKDENIDMATWNFHWGAVVMKSSGDMVTMENFAGSGTDAWDFQMYGPATKAGQTFHEQQKSRKKHDGVTPEYGDNPTTVRARPTD